MKKLLLIITVLILLIAAVSFSTLDLNVKQDSGERVSPTSVQRRPIAVASVTADADDPNVDEKTWTDALSLCVQIPTEWSYIVLSFYGYGNGSGAGDPNNATFSYDIYVCDVYGGLECVASANTGTIGAQQLSHNPVTGAQLNAGDPNSSYCWADDLNEGTKKTTSTIAYSDYEETSGMAKLKFDRHSSYGVYVKIYDMTAQSVTSITCIANGFNQ